MCIDYGFLHKAMMHLLELYKFKLSGIGMQKETKNKGGQKYM